MTDDDLQSRLEEQQATIDDQQERIDQLEATIQQMLPSRRDALKLLGGAGAGAVAGQAVFGSASADNNEVGTIGTTQERVDLNAEDVDAISVSTDEQLTLPVYPTLGDVPTDLPEGTLVWVADENSVYKETGT